MPKKIKVQCIETGKVFNSLIEASIWLKGDKLVNPEHIRIKLSRMINGKKFKTSKKNEDDYPSYSRVWSIYGYTFRKVE